MSQWLRGVLNGRRVAAALLAVVSVACAVGAVVAFRHASVLERSGVRVPGRVVEVVDRRWDAHVVVEFRTPDGRRVVAPVGNYRWDPAPRVGDVPVLVYDPADPAGNVADVRLGPDPVTAWACVSGALLAGALARPTWTGAIDWDRLR